MHAGVREVSSRPVRFSCLRSTCNAHSGTAVSAMPGRRTITVRRDSVASREFDPVTFYDNRALDFPAETNRKDETLCRVVSTLHGRAAPVYAANPL